MASFDITLKFIIVGEASVGKTVLTKRFVKDEFISDTLPTIGNDYFKLEKQIDGYKTLIQFWDTAGQERYRSVSSKIYEDARAIMIVYDTTNRASFDRAKYWYDAVLEKCKLKATIMLVGNKIDLIEKRQVSVEEGREMAGKFNMLFMETSAKSNENGCVQRSFETVIGIVTQELIREEREQEKEEERLLRSSVVPLDLQTVETRKSCC